MFAFDLEDSEDQFLDFKVQVVFGFREDLNLERKMNSESLTGNL